jgi:hypothetical protein
MQIRGDGSGVDCGVVGGVSVDVRGGNEQNPCVVGACRMVCVVACACVAYGACGEGGDEEGCRDYRVACRGALNCSACRTACGVHKGYYI